MLTNLKPEPAIQEGQHPFINPLQRIQSKLISFYTVAELCKMEKPGVWRTDKAQLS